MPLYRNRTVFELVRGIKAFLKLEVGLTRGEVPDMARDLAQARSRLEERDRKISQLQEQLTSGGRDGRPSLHAEFDKRRPWVTKFVIGGEEYGGESNAMNDPRVDLFFQSFPEARRILELGSLEGGHTFNLASRPGVERVLGVEGRGESVEKAQFVQGVLGVENVEFAVANLETAELGEFGEFDAIFCSGLLYHLPEPWTLIEKASRVSPNLFVWTHYAEGDAADAAVPALRKARNTTRNGFEGWEYGEHGLKDPLSGMSPTSFWPTLEGLKRMLGEHGFSEVRIIKDNPNNPHGPAVTLAASATS